MKICTCESIAYIFEYLADKGIIRTFHYLCATFLLYFRLFFGVYDTLRLLNIVLGENLFF